MRAPHIGGRTGAIDGPDLCSLLLPGVGLAADASANTGPRPPDMGFLSACSYETVTAVGAETTTVTRGTDRRSRPSTPRDGHWNAGYGQRACGLWLERGESRCYLTDADAELICIHPPGTAAAEAPATPIAVAPVATGLAGFGGGQTGYCLLSETSGAAESLTEYGACVKRENCLESEDGGTSCVTDYGLAQWPDHRDGARGGLAYARWRRGGGEQWPGFRRRSGWRAVL